jgi:hypothetical protein
MIIDKFTIQTQDSIAIARDRLNSQIDDKPSPFKICMTGQVSGNTFKLYRVRGRGIPLTIINGWFEDIRSGTVVNLELEVKSSVIIVYLIFVLFFPLIYGSIK